MHAFVRETRLSEREWELGVSILNRIGQATHDLHNEGILFSDAIGVSTLVCLLNNGDNGATENASALLGPFWRMSAPVMQNGGSIVRSETAGPDAVRRLPHHRPGGPAAAGRRRCMSGTPRLAGSTRTRIRGRRR